MLQLLGEFWCLTVALSMNNYNFSLLANLFVTISPRTCLHVHMHSSPVHKSLRGSFLLITYTLWFHHKPQSSYAKSKNQRLCLHDINSVWRITAGDESWLSFFESGSRGHAWKQRPCSSSFNIQESWTVNWSLRLKLSTRKEEEKLCLAVGRGLSSLKP